MKKLFLIPLALLILCSVCLGQESNKIKGTITLKNDWISSPNDIPALSAYFHWKSLGGGFDVNYYTYQGSIEFQPYVTLNKGPFYALVGYSIDSNRAQHIQAGGFYSDSFGKLNVFLKVRNWWSLDPGKAKSRFNPFAQIIYPLPKPFNIDDKIYFGVEGEINHWWSGPSHNWYLVGPIVGCKITKNLDLFVRLSHEWDVRENATENAFRIRTGIAFNF